MILRVLLLWGCLVGSALSRVVHQADGIVSIITELEPDRTPVGYLQVVDGPPPSGTGRGVPVVVNTERPPLEEGQFRVSSEKIQVVDPKTGFKVVHQAPVSVTEKNKDERAPSRESDKQTEAKAESTDRKEVNTEPRHDGENRIGDSSFKGDFNSREGFPKKTKPGKYGYQTPRKGNVRLDKNTKIRNDGGPMKGYSHTVVRPFKPREEFVTSKKKPGKPGRYVTFSVPPRDLDKVPNSDRKSNSNNFERERLSISDPEQHKVEKEYSSRTFLEYPEGFAQGNERRVESSSNYRTGSRERSLIPASNKRFNGRHYPSSIYDMLDNDRSLEGSSSFLDSSASGIDDSSIESSYPGRDYYGGSIGGSFGGFRGGYGKENHFEKEGGKDYVSAHNSAHGAKGEKSFSDDGSFSKEQREKHGQGEKKGFSEEKEGDKKAHLDKSSQFASGHQTSEGAKGENFHKDKGHRKGHKKSGYRSVVHKDEYKNKEEFYDEEHDSGEEKQQGHKSQHHEKKAGGQGKKEHLDVGHHEAHRGHAGGHQNGHEFQQQQGYHKDHGHSGQYGHQEEYGKKSGHKAGEIHGHKEFGGYL